MSSLSIRHAIAQLLPVKLHASDGPLTQELTLEPSPLGFGRVPRRLLPTACAGAVCGFCSTGCKLNVHLRDGQAINVTPASDSPVNLGMACPKGWEAVSVLRATERATAPLLRDRKGNLRPVDWDTALRAFCHRLKEIQARYGPESVAFLSTGQITTEEMALLGALTKFGMGIVHGDGNTRQCMATAVTAYKQAFGFDAPPYTYQDFEESDVIVLIGSNLCIAHPIMWQRVLRNRHQPEVIVVDPRRTETAMAATEHVALRPKSDLPFLYAIAHVLIQKGWVDHTFIQEHTSGFDEFCEHVQAFDPASVASICNVPEEQIYRVARTIHHGQRVSFWWTMGVNQSYQGVRTAQAIINLALMTGNIGRPGTGPNSITGQCNAMGSRLFSNTTNLLGGREFENPAHRREVAAILGIDAGVIPDQSSWPYHRILEGILRDQIKALWVIGTNPAHSWINQNMCRDIFSRLECLVVQDMYFPTATAQSADIFFPAAGWGEKEGTFINSERRVGLIKQVAQPPGDALADFSIFRSIAECWGCGEMFSAWPTPAAVFEILKQLSRGRPCDISGIADYQTLEACGGIQWPWPQTVNNADGASSASSFSPPTDNQRRLFEDGRFYHPDGRARFLFEQPRRMPESPNPRFPYLLLTGRGSAAQWHTQTRTARSAVLRKLAPEQIYVEINPHDARREGIRPNQDVIVESQRGRLRARAFVTPTVQPGQIFIPMHYEATNRLTLAHFDPYSHQPSYKNCAVRVRRAEGWDDV